MCVSLTNGPIGSENHHLEMACGGKYPNKGSGVLIRTPILIGRRSTSHSPTTGTHIGTPITNAYIHTSSRVVWLLPDRPPEVSHMAYCCVMGTTGLDEKMYNIIGHWGLRLAGSILLILNAMVVVSFCHGYTHSHEKLPIIRCPISLLATTLLSVR